MPNSCLDFNYLKDKLYYLTNLMDFLTSQEFIEEDENKYLVDFNKYWTLNYDDFLFIFIKNSYKKYEQNSNNNHENEGELQLKEEDFFIYLKINLIEKK